MRIGIISQWYEPEPGPAALPAVLARALAERGHDVHVLTGFPNYPSGEVAPGYRQVLPRLREQLGGVQVIRVPLYVNHDASALRRIANYTSFGLSAAVLGVPSLPKLDALWVNYSPITTGLPMWAQQLMQGTPTVCEVGDLWPDTMAVSGLTGAGPLKQLGEGLLSKWCGAMYASSDAVAYISPGVGKILESRGVPRSRLRYIPKPADESVFHEGGRSLRAELGIAADAVVLVYAGAMGAAQGLHALIQAAALVDDPRLVVLMAGSGNEEQALRGVAESLGASSVRFLGRLPQAQMADLHATADIAFVSLTRHPLSEVTMPSKTQASLATGTAILAAAGGDLAELVRTRGVGFTAEPGDPHSIAEALRAALEGGQRALVAAGHAARRLYDAEFSVQRTTTQAEELLGAIAQGPRRNSNRLRPVEVQRA